MVSKLIAARKITEVLHFTTDNGVIGVLTTGYLIPRAQLRQEEQLEYILTPNCDVRKDPQWTNYNSLSISQINTQFFDFSEREHGATRDLWWCILAFDSVILTHPKVWFSTGNNIWPRSLKSTGADGFARMFAEEVPGRYNSIVRRNAGLPDNVPTSFEAEVLYPGRISIEHLSRVYFRTQDHADHFLAVARTLQVHLADGITCVAPQKFRGR